MLYKFTTAIDRKISCRFSILGRFVTGQSYQDYIPRRINEVDCTGDEATLSGCSVTRYSSNCGSDVGAGVSCYSSKSIYIHEPKSHHNNFHVLAPKRPTNVEITFINSSSIQVSWLPPDMGNCTDVDGYRIICSDYISCYRSYYFMEETPSHSSNVTFHDPYDDDNFNSCIFYCRVSGNNSAGVGPASYVYGRECSLFLVRFLFIIIKLQLPPALQET